MHLRPRFLHRIFKKLRPVGMASAALATGLAPRNADGADGGLRLVETWPIEVALGTDAPFASAHEVWVEMIEGARSTIDLAHFYASDREGSRLEPVIVALERAAERGVRVRWIGEDRFYGTYPGTLDRLDAHEGIEVRRLRTSEVLGGVLHTKIMLVDSDRACLGSQNFDWRALEHIVELGVRIDDSRVVGVFDRVFAFDWDLAGGADPEDGLEALRTPLDSFPVESTYRGDPVRVTPVLSPPAFIPDAQLWDLDHLLNAIDGARASVRTQMLSYSPVTRDGEHWPALDNALRAAAVRGVRVELLVSHWNTRAGEIEHLQSLQCVPGIEVRVATVPEWSGGFVPFSRTIHAKSLVVDGAWSWVGTSNWSRGYFHGGRHHGLVVEGEGFARDVSAFFDRTWTADWTATVDPGRTYPAPRVAE